MDSIDLFQHILDAGRTVQCSQPLAQKKTNAENQKGLRKGPSDQDGSPCYREECCCP